MARALAPTSGAPGTRGRTRLARAERRVQIENAAATLFAGREASQVTFDEIAEAAGVSRALVYNYFGDRHRLLEALYRRAVRELDGRVAAALAAERGMGEALRRAIRTHLGFALEDASAYRYAAGQVAFNGLTELSARRRENFATTFGGGPEGELIAQGLLDMTHGMVLLWLEHRADVDVERAVDLITALIGRGTAGVRDEGLPLNPGWKVPAG